MSLNALKNKFTYKVHSQGTVGEVKTNSLVMFFHGLLHIDTPVLDN